MWAAVVCAAASAFTGPSEKREPRPPDPYVEALITYATCCAQGALLNPDPKGAGEMMGESTKAIWQIVEHGLRETLNGVAAYAASLAEARERRKTNAHE